VLRRLTDDCYIQVLQKDADRHKPDDPRVWRQETFKVDATRFGSPFTMKRDVEIFTRVGVEVNLKEFFNSKRVRTRWENSLILTPTLRGLNNNQVISYRHFLYNNQNKVNVRVLIPRYKTGELYCKVLLPGDPLPTVNNKENTCIIWNVYDNFIRETYDVNFSYQIKLVLGDTPHKTGQLPREIISTNLPERFYKELELFITR
jgi:hypothetical protein